MKRVATVIRLNDGTPKLLKTPVVAVTGVTRSLFFSEARMFS